MSPASAHATGCMKGTDYEPKWKVRRVIDVYWLFNVYEFIAMSVVDIVSFMIIACHEGMPENGTTNS